MLTPVPPSDCERARKAVSAQLDGELSELGSARLAGHLSACPACSVYAFEVAAVAKRIRSAPLERPTRALELQSRRRPGVRLVAAAAVAAAAAVSAVTLGQALRPASQPAWTATGVITAPTLEQDMVSQHILAMERKLPVSTLRVGTIVAV